MLDQGPDTVWGWSGILGYGPVRWGGRRGGAARQDLTVSVVSHRSVPVEGERGDIQFNQIPALRHRLPLGEDCSD